MERLRLSNALSATGQLAVGDVASAKAEGFRSILCTRPDGEEAKQIPFAAIAAEAERQALAVRHVPIVSGQMTDADVTAFRAAIDDLPKPILGYCRSGRRVSEAAQAAGLGGDPSISESAIKSGAPGTEESHQIVVVGGGSGGIATAASLLARSKDLDIAIIEPANVHYYQPGWTMVGAGIFRPEETRREMASVMPSRVSWIKGAVASFQPTAKTVFLDDGRVVRYEKLIVATGLTLDWTAVDGLSETLGQNGVTSNYRYDLASYTWALTKALKGGTALFTQPPMPIKCAGAPQKVMYLACDTWRRNGSLAKTDVEFLNAGPALFGVADYVPPLMEYVKRYGIRLSFGHNLVKVDGPAQTAWFKRSGADGASEMIERRFDMLHVTPPQRSPDVIRTSQLAASSGWLDVDPQTLRHNQYPDVYGVGDVMATTNAKTAAAARKQAPTVAVNILRDLGRLTGAPAVYDGYGSCPLTVERGKIILAEFGYGGKRMPSFPRWFIDDLRPSRIAWHLKETGLPKIYWQAMLKGREPMARPVTTPAKV